MCLGEVAQVVAVEEGSLVVRRQGERRAVSALTLDALPQVGDWVLIHSGFALGLLSDEEAAEALAFREERQRDAL